MDKSILTSIKKLLGIDEAYTAFDADITMYINSVFSVLHQLGIGPLEGFMIEDKTEKWSDFIQDELVLNSVITYMGLRVRMMFDPPETSFAIAAIEKQIEEFGWRINVQREFDKVPVPVIVVVEEEL